MSIEKFIAGLHVCLDKISELNIDVKLRCNLMLRQALMFTLGTC